MKEDVELSTEAYDFWTGRDNEETELEKELHEVKKQLGEINEELRAKAEIGDALMWAAENFNKANGTEDLLEGLYTGDIQGYNVDALLKAYRKAKM